MTPPRTSTAKTWTRVALIVLLGTAGNLFFSVGMKLIGAVPHWPRSAWTAAFAPVFSSLPMGLGIACMLQFLAALMLVLSWVGWSYKGIATRSLWSRLEAIKLSSKFMLAVRVARLLKGLRFARGATMALRREGPVERGGFEALAHVAANDHDLGRRLWARGHRVELFEASVQTVCSTRTRHAVFDHRLRGAVMI